MANSIKHKKTKSWSVNSSIKLSVDGCGKCIHRDVCRYPELLSHFQGELYRCNFTKDRNKEYCDGWEKMLAWYCSKFVLRPYWVKIREEKLKKKKK